MDNNLFFKIGEYTVGEYISFDLSVIDNEISRLLFTENDFYKEIENEDFSCGFRTTAKICKKRLEIFGITIQKAEKDFNRVKNNIIEYSNEGENSCPHDHFYNRKKNSLEKIDYSSYINAIRKIVNENIYDQNKFFSDNYLEALEGNRCFFHDFNSSSYQEISYWIYSMLSVVSDDTIISLECWDFLDSIDDDYPIEIKKRTPIIVLTEGKTDTEFIESSLRLLYPDIAPYYRFIDYDNVKISGGASYLVHTVKVLIGTGVVNKTIALFDNDIAGKSEMKTLKDITLPLNMKIAQYPDINICNLYPVVSVNGTIHTNVNGIAGSIEMYFGKDVLKNNDNKLYPVYTSKYEHNNKQYQCAFGDEVKKNVQREFRNKLKKAESNLNELDFSDMELILHQIMHIWDNCED